MAAPSAREIAETQREATLGTTQRLIQQQAARSTNPSMTGTLRPMLIGMGILLLVGVALFGVGWPLVQKLMALLFAKLGFA
ncbi:MAG: hypothetical protein JWM77_3776 [Rhodospirillales bacterium]|jgi:hypothetical protein|nr:hypothetical protein [Rhodospirillales bacterium]